MARIIVLICGIALIVDAGALAYRVIQITIEKSELTIERIVAAIVALIAVSAGVFFIASV